MSTVISVENVSKRYRLGLIGSRTLHDDFERWLAQVRGKPNPLLKIGQEDYDNRQGEYIWALRDVSFEVQQGEVLGIIGRNGAGKSTLLKILSRVTAPTSGQVKVKGRVASLLEVGTGFHPELTGRENIYLNGAILGMKKAEIERKFDEIVAFAEIEKFMDTPVKRYSSGMYVRLAFAVAAHLEPEILLVDEVLAVGDAAFQKKCLGKMGDVAKEGRTVLFVSHNMAAVTNLCGRAVLLHSGRIVQIGAVSEVVQAYLASVDESGSIALGDRRDRKGDGRLRITQVSLADEQGNPVDCLQSGMDAQIILHYKIPSGKRLRNVLVSIGIDSIWGQRLCMLQTDYAGSNLAEIGSEGRIICSIPRLPLAAGVYPFTLFVTANGVIVDWVSRAGRLRVEGSDFYGHGKYPDPQDGPMLMHHTWMCCNDS